MRNSYYPVGMGAYQPYSPNQLQAVPAQSSPTIQTPHNCASEIQTLKADKKRGDFFITMTAIAGLLGAFIKFLQRRTQPIQLLRY